MSSAANGATGRLAFGSAPCGWNVPSASWSAVVVEPLCETSPRILPDACSVRMRSRSSLARASSSSMRTPYFASKADATFGSTGVPTAPL